MLVLAVMVSGLAAVYCLVVQWPLWSVGRVGLALSNLAVTVAYGTAAVFVARGRGHLTTGLGLALAAVVWPLNWVNEWRVGVWPVVAALVGPAGALCAVWAMLRYPVEWNRRWKERTVIACLVAVQVVSDLSVLVSRPEWQGLPPSTPWLSVRPTPGAFALAQTAYHVGGVVLAIGAAIGITVRYARLHQPDRRVMRPVLGAVLVAGGFGAASNAAAQLAPHQPLVNALYTSEQLGYVCVPIAFAVSAAWRNTMQSNVAEFAARLRSAVTPAAIQGALAVLLGDPRLQLLYRSDSGFVDMGGQPAGDPGTAAMNVAAIIPVPSGGDVVVVARQAQLTGYDAFVTSASTAAALALDNVAAQVAIKAQIVEIERSTHRLAEAVALEARYVNERVEAIASRQLSRVADRLSSIAANHVGTGVAEEAHDVLREIEHASAELNRLASGAGVDLSTGLVEVVVASVRRLVPGISLDVAIPALPENLGQVVYFAASELVTNAAKHAPGARVALSIRPSGLELVLTVADDGPGGAVLTLNGLGSLAHRVSQVGGNLAVTTDGPGTTAVVRFPIRKQADLEDVSTEP